VLPLAGLSVTGPSYRNCDGINRRRFLTAGALGLGGLSLSELLRAEEQAGIRASRKAIIQIHLDGGPPQMDTIDLKPEAPREIRGEFKPISTRLPGFQVCELLPKLASNANDWIFIRSLTGSAGRHDAFQCQSGFDQKSMSSIGGRPALGCVLNKLWSSSNDTAPTFVDLMQGRPLVRNSARPGFLGPALKPFRPDISEMFARPLEAGMKNELAKQGGGHLTSMSLHEELSSDRIADRQWLLGQLDRIQRKVDRSGMMNAMDQFHLQATNILTSGHFADAMDLNQEDPRTLDLYTAPEAAVDRFTTAENHMAMRKLLLARRLVEAGVRCVSVSFSDFDTHSSNFPRMKHMLPILDHGLHALITDLRQRGMLDDVTILVWGEFGRSPKINDKGGRDHWPSAGMAMMAGGGLQTGQVIGSTDRTASTPTSRPVTYQDIMATVYHRLGINASRTTIQDPTGRPQYLLDGGQVLPEAI
jgi:hypothetical protein